MTSEKTTAELLYKGLDKLFDPKKFEEKKKEFNKRLISEIIEDTLEGKIDWRRDLRPKKVVGNSVCVRDGIGIGLNSYVADIQVKNTAEDEVDVKVLYYNYVYISDMGPMGDAKWFLQVGEGEGSPSDNDEEVQRLAKTYFKLK